MNLCFSTERMVSWVATAYLVELQYGAAPVDANASVKSPATKINWTSDLASRALEVNRREVMHHYHVDVTTELDEHETLTITAVSGTDAEDQAMELVAKGLVGLQGRKCTSMEVFDAE